MFIDRARIFVKGGDGGNGLLSFRRELYVPRGGPDGGDGGSGGHVIIIATSELNTLLPFRYETLFNAQPGGGGRGRKCHGKQGPDLFVRVPPGTLVIDDESDAVIADLVREGQQVQVARGGRGGLGNTHFATPTHQAPRIAEKGEPGTERWLRLELKLIADVGLVGYPNAGKSTLIAAMSAARPKIADYPFTTLEPNLGVVEVGHETFVVADIPGLIEGAHRGVGLGDEFLRHVERTSLLVQVIDASGQEGRDPLDDFRVIEEELGAYRPELVGRPRLVALNKLDLTEARENRPRLEAALAAKGHRVLGVAAATGEGVRELVYEMHQLLAQHPREVSAPDPDDVLVITTAPGRDRAWQIEHASEHHWRVTGERIERLTRMTDFEQEEASERFQRVLAQSGISARLVKDGILPGDTVHIAEKELTWDQAAFELERAAQKRAENPDGLSRQVAGVRRSKATNARRRAKLKLREAAR